MRKEWLIACSAGEALGIAAVSAVYAAIDRGVLSGSPAWILMAGGWEGLCLGGAQAWVLRKHAHLVRWAALTVAGAVAGYGLSVLGGAGSSEAVSTEPPLALTVMLGAALGLAMGVLIGGVQAMARARGLSAGSWIFANALGWAPAMAIIMLAASSVSPTWPLVAIAAAGAATGSLAGLALGLVTAAALPRGNGEK